MNCPICQILVDEEFINDHLDECLGEVQILDQSYNQYQEPDLTSAQEKALTYANLKAKIHSKQTRGIILSRFIGLGYTENDLNKVLNYLQFDCDVTINCPTNILIQHIVNSTHFKNGYEVNRYEAYLKSRTEWENNLFNNAYSETEFVERPKYGALNVLQLSTGSANAYGHSYFVLKPEVKNRITFVNGDSSLQMFHICTFSNPIAILIHLSDQHINMIVGAMNSHFTKIQPMNYIECQIHGMLRFNFDFKKLYLCLRECNNFEIENIKKFCEHNNIEFNKI